MEEYNKIFNMEHKLSEEKKLELRLGPPGEFLGHDKKNFINGGKRVFYQKHNYNEKECNNVQCSRSVVKLECSDKNKACSASLTCNSFAAAAPLKRVAATTVVGWPPIGAFRKNIATANKTDPSLSPQVSTAKETDSLRNDLFVKINMEGVPIGRKINLNAYDTYHKLSLAIDDLFRGLLAAQRGTCGGMNVKKNDEGKSKSKGESGEYTLVYEDSEGDRMLVGDVPWDMFVGTAKRLRVLKCSELCMPPLSVGRREQDMTPLHMKDEA